MWLRRSSRSISCDPGLPSDIIWRIKLAWHTSRGGFEPWKWSGGPSHLDFQLLRVLFALIDESLLDNAMSHTVAAMSSGQPEEKKKHRGLGRLLGKRDKTPERPDHLPDSAYGSSEANSADGAVAGRSTPDMVSAEKNSEIANIDQDRNLALRPSTGEVFDEDTGGYSS